jgi:hypothetical protein
LSRWKAKGDDQINVLLDKMSGEGREAVILALAD